MPSFAANHRVMRRTAAGLACALGLAGGPAADWSAAAQTQPPSARKPAAQTAAAKTERPASSGKSEQAIIALVNDEPITAYEVEQRARFLSASTNLGDKVKENFQRLAQAESTTQKVRAILEEVIRSNPGKSREQVAAIFEERKKQFGLGLQKQALESARASLMPKLRKEAQEELIDERLKLQEAKKVGVELSDDDVKRMFKGIADRNKMSEEQFTQHIKGMGVDVNTMKERMKVQAAWTEVIRRRFAAQISVTQREIDRMISTTASEAGEDAVELQLQKITLTIPKKPDQAALARRYTEAEGLQRKFAGCKGMASLAQGLSDARFDDLKFVKPSSIPEPTRSMLLAAKDGDVLPPTATAAAIEIYAVCGRRAVRPDEKQREKVQGDLAAKEFDILAKRHLRNLRQDAHIEYR